MKGTRLRLLAAGLGSAVFLLAAPGIVAGLLPWQLTHWRSTGGWLPARIIGVLLIAGGAWVLLLSFARFVVEGLGTPAPAAPTQRLVIGGYYRYVRNPMYVAVAATLIGQALLFGAPELLMYWAVFMAAVMTFVYGYEQPTLASRFGADYEKYRANVPAWLPRLSPWSGRDQASGREGAGCTHR